ncbi:MAG TPA: hypothetical protein VJM34_05800, partial [Novosphingobium sp.]|nr:hypothetical protein [Novosphingobium sp.]
QVFEHAVDDPSAEDRPGQDDGLSAQIQKQQRRNRADREDMSHQDAALPGQVAHALAVAMGLRFMGLANEIVIIAFAGIIGSTAVASALAFGLGGRAAAGRLLDHWVARLQRSSPSADPPRAPSTGAAGLDPHQTVPPG